MELECGYSPQDETITILSFFGSPEQQPRQRSLLESYPWEEHCSETPLRSSPFVQTLITNYYTHTHTHTHKDMHSPTPPHPTPDPSPPSLWTASLTSGSVTSAGIVAAGPDGCLLELDYFPCGIVVCLWCMCFCAEVFFLFSHCTPQGA